jgi:hypothetical protein
MTTFTLLAVATRSFAQTVPMSSYEIKTSRGTYSGVLVGGNPTLATKPVTIDAVLIPLIVQVIRTDGTLVTYDPTAQNDCDNNVSAAYSFEHSPLVVPSDLKFNGVDVGKAQYIDGFMRAQFWNAPGHSRSSYTNHLNWSFTSPVLFPVVLNPQNTIFHNTGCSEEAIVSQDVFNPHMEGFIQLLQSKGVISTTKFVYFLMSHVVTSDTNPPTTTGLKGGQHYATGSPKQTWARGSGGVKTAYHEIGEWMNDPLVTNPAPRWGYIGEVKNGCSGAFEVGDPLNGIGVPITLSGVVYNVQELAFFSWFFNPEGFFSYGAGGKFSSNGTFKGPSKPCVPGDPSSGGTN